MRHEVTHFCNALFYSFREKNRTHLLLVFIYCKYLTTISPAAVVTLDQRFEIVFVSPASAIDKTLTLIGRSVVPPSWNGCEAESSILWHRTNVHWWSCYIIKIKGWSLIERKLLLSPLYFGREQMSLGWTVILYKRNVIDLKDGLWPSGNYHCKVFDWLYSGWSSVIWTFTVCYWWMNDHRPIPFNYQSVEWMGQELICWIFWQIKLCPFVPMTMLCMVIVGLTIFFFTYLLGKHKLIYYVQF